MTTTANGWPLIALPAPWHLLTMDWAIHVPVTANVSPFTGQVAQVVQWIGADSWSVNVTIPPLTAIQARDWTSFLWDAQGGASAFLLGDPLRRTPQGSVSTPVVVSGTNSAMAGTLNLRGFKPLQPRALLRGDLISCNYRLYQVRDPYVSADPNGNLTVTIGPSLREALTDGMPVQTHDAQGMFRLAKSVSPFSVDQNRLYSMSLACLEAR